LFPGENIQETWIGGGGATLSLHNGELVATRGFGDDLMGTSVLKSKAFIERRDTSYTKKIRCLTPDNKNNDHNLRYKIQRERNH
jgi:hypothetical protein